MAGDLLCQFCERPEADVEMEGCFLNDMGGGKIGPHYFGEPGVHHNTDGLRRRPWTMPSQADVLQWARDRWPDRCTPIWRAAKLAEEAGEVMGAVIKSGEKPPRKTDADIAQETAQLVICAMGLAEAVGFDLFDEVIKEYERCTDYL